MKTIDANDARVKAAAQQLGITIILRAWEEDGVLYVQDPWDTHSWDVPAEVPAGNSRADTLPQPAASPDVPARTSGPAGKTGTPLADFTAIPGIGSVTAEKLHYDHGLTTFEELHEALREGTIDDIPAHVQDSARTWLDQREEEDT